MLKEPTTKHLQDEVLLTAVNENGEPFHRMFPDEEFYSIPQYPNYYVSQYGNVMSIVGSKPHLLKQYSAGPYLRVNFKNKRGSRLQPRVHDIVAQVWLQPPSFECDSRLEVHHKKKVISYGYPTIKMNYAENLMYVYQCYHSMLESIRSMKYLQKSRWKKATEPEEIAEYYNVCPKDIYDLLSGEPTSKDEKSEIYELDNIKIKIERYKA